jgi:hypothetical protein
MIHEARSLARRRARKVGMTRVSACDAEVTASREVFAAIRRRD